MSALDTLSPAATPIFPHGEPRVVVLVSEDPSDLFFANRLARRLNVVGVLVERQRLLAGGTPRWRKALRMARNPLRLAERCIGLVADTLRRRFADYVQPENAADFGEDGRHLRVAANLPVRFTAGVNRINDDSNVAWVAGLQPDVIAVCGTSILRAPMLGVPRLGTLNLHGGLAQRYRGLFTTEWAFHNAEPEYVGATVHHVAPGVDDGDVVFQGRPELEPEDQPHSAYVKVVHLGVEMMTTAIQDLGSGRNLRARLTQHGRLYRRADFDARARARAWRQARKGVVREYLQDKARRDEAVRRLMINEFQGDAAVPRAARPARSPASSPGIEAGHEPV